MLKKFAFMSLMTLILAFGGLQLTVQKAEAANPACLACCPPTNGNQWLYDCTGPFPYPVGDIVGCAYTDGMISGPLVPYVCGQQQQ